MVPTYHPDLTGLLVAFIRGTCPPEIIADWLEERGDSRAVEIREEYLSIDEPHDLQRRGM